MNAFRVDILATFHQACPSEWWWGEEGKMTKNAEVKYFTP
jgi:hypothetical protein